MGARTISKGYQATGNDALVVADAAVRQAMWVLRDAHRVRDNIIRHRMAFIQRRKDARKDFDLVQQSVMDALSKDPRDTTGGRTTAQWLSAGDFYEDMDFKAFNAAEEAYWWNMGSVAFLFRDRRGSSARNFLLRAGKRLQTWEQENSELQADKELERARQRESY